jgi:hypothetical protein
MKTLLAAIAYLGAASLAHAELIAPAGAKATLEVEYVYTSEGSYASPSRDQTSKWNVRRVVKLTAEYAADAPQPFGVMHEKDPQQRADAQEQQARAASAQKKMQPTMADMMKIAAECEAESTEKEGPQQGQVNEARNQACLTRKVSSYGSSMEPTSDLTSAGADIEAMGKPTAARFQLWRLVSQTGTYSVDEQLEKQVFEMTCTATKVCKRVELRRGGGAVPAPAGKSVAGASMFEVDAAKKDVMLALPVPLAPLDVTRTVTTSIPGDQGGTSQVVTPPFMLRAAKAMPVAAPGDLPSASGRKSFVVEGPQAEGGTLTVTWKLSRQ